MCGAHLAVSFSTNFRVLGWSDVMSSGCLRASTSTLLMAGDDRRIERMMVPYIVRNRQIGRRCTYHHTSASNYCSSSRHCSFVSFAPTSRGLSVEDIRNCDAMTKRIPKLRSRDLLSNLIFCWRKLRDQSRTNSFDAIVTLTTCRTFM